MGRRGAEALAPKSGLYYGVLAGDGATGAVTGAGVFVGTVLDDDTGAVAEAALVGAGAGAADFSSSCCTVEACGPSDSRME